MTPKKYRKKPVTIEAMELTKGNFKEVQEWVLLGGRGCTVDGARRGLMIETLEGAMLAGWTDFVIKGIQGEMYPCKADIFWKTYEEVS